MKSENLIAEISSLLEPWLARRPEMRQRAVQWLESPSFQESYYDDAHPPFAAKFLFQQTDKKAAAAELWKKCQIFGIQSPELWAQYQDLAKHGELVFGQVIIVNPQLAETPHHSLPCLIVVPREQSLYAVASTASTAAILGEIYAGVELRYPELEKLLQDDEYQFFRRRPLVRGEISNVEAQLYDVLLRLSWLPPREIPFVPLLIQPGAKGAIVQIPWSVATGGMPVPDSFSRGVWGEVADIDREADEQLRLHNAKRAGLWPRFLRGCRWLLLILVGWAALVLLWEEFSGSKQKPAAAASRKAPVKRIVWEQPPDIRRNISIVSSEDYEPLNPDGKTGRSFLFQVRSGLLLAATPKRPSGLDALAPRQLDGAENLTISLDAANVHDQPQSRIQLVTQVSGTADALAFRSDDMLQPNDELWLILGKGNRLTGHFDRSTPHQLNKPPVQMKLRVASGTDRKFTRGLPVVHAKTGRVVGMLLSWASRQSSMVLTFETISLNPGEE